MAASDSNLLVAMDAVGEAPWFPGTSSDAALKAAETKTAFLAVVVGMCMGCMLVSV